MQIDALLRRLDPSGTIEEDTGGVLVRCPAHPDGRPSLLVGLSSEGTASLYCRAGCSTADVLQAAEMEMADLFRVAGEPTVTKIEYEPLGGAPLAALASYVDWAASRFTGSPAEKYAARRFGVTPDLAEAFKLGYDDGASELFSRDYRSESYRAHPRLVVPFLDWQGNPRGLQGRDIGGRCPVRWAGLQNPRGADGKPVMRWDTTGVVRADTAYDTVLVTEGPGDALATASAGYTATFVRGAGVARAERTAQEIAAGASGAAVVLAGDNDRSGRQFNDALGESLTAHEIQPRTLVFPLAHKDICKWRDASGDAFARKLHTAVSDAPQWTSAPARRDGEGVRLPMDGTDIENARYALRVVGPDTAHVEGVGFLTWTGTHWRPMSRSRENAIGHRVADAMRAELDEMPKGDPKGSGEEREQARDHVEATKRVRRMHMDSGIQAALTHLKTITGRDVEEFDAAPHLLAFRNGVVDLRTGELLDHDREHMLTRLVDLEYDPEAPAPRWEQFLAEVFPGDPEMPEMPAFIRRLIGYGITGETREHVFALLYGHGANGKSVLVNTLAYAFSGITTHMSQAAIALARSYDAAAPNPALAALRGARLAVLSELSDGLRLNEALLKQVTAGDPVVARELYKGQFTFHPTALLIMATNYKPDVRGQDDGFWRRTRLIPFTREFTVEDRDATLPERLREEIPGIIAWAVRGAVEWYRDGLQEPASVSMAVEEYRRSADVLEGFLPGVLVRDPAGQIKLKDAFDLFLDWRVDEHVEPVLRWGKQRFRQQLESRKVAYNPRGTGGVGWLIGVRAAEKG